MRQDLSDLRSAPVGSLARPRCSSGPPRSSKSAEIAATIFVARFAEARLARLFPGEETEVSVLADFAEVEDRQPAIGVERAGDHAVGGAHHDVMEAAIASQALVGAEALEDALRRV